MEKEEECDQLETTSLRSKEEQLEMSKGNNEKKDSELTDAEVEEKLSEEEGSSNEEPASEGSDEAPEEDSPETPVEPVVEMTEEQASDTVSRLVELATEVDEASGMFAIAKSEGVRSGLKSTLLEQAKEAEDLILKWGQYHEWANEVMEPALRGHSAKPGDAGEVNTYSYGFRLIPEAFQPILGEVVTEGRRPHNACPHCVCDPTGGVNLDLERMKSAKELLEPIQSKFAVRLCPMIGAGIKAETSPFVKPKRAGGGGGGGGSRESLEEIEGIVDGTTLYRNYSGNLITAKVSKDGEGKLSIHTEKPSKGDKPTNTHYSLSAAAQCYTQVNGKAWWSWQGKPASFPGSNKDLPATAAA